jgi:alpha-tubulin suppressor-like RCC1 family protein
MTGVKAIAAGGTFSMALKNDNSLWTWGGYGYGELGDGTVSQSPIPVKVVFPEILLGDVNGDEKINTGDAVLLLQYIVGKATLNEEQLSAADFNQDKKLNTGDAMAILKHLVS